MSMSVENALVSSSKDFVTTEMSGEQVCPTVGMVFASPDEAFEFYKIYSRKVGFGVTRRTSHNFYDIKYDVTFACNKNRKSGGPEKDEGFANRTHGILGTGCRAKLVLRDRLLRGDWTIEEVCLEHNHELAPDCVRLMRCHRTIPLFVKKQLEINELAGLAQNKSISAVFTQAGGVTQCNFTARDMRNYIAEVRRLQLSKGDAAALMDYFRRQQDRSPYFYCSYDLDDDGRLNNVFWADARSRSAYKYFGDVITFDTTYLTNRYRMPFAVFVGVNHHGQSILLGCALLSNEMTETFEWCFHTFLSCMHGKHPEAIITDQCGAICGAITEVLPFTRHRLCLWHILKKLPEKLAGAAEKDKIMHAICTAVYDSTCKAEFDTKWLDLLSKRQLGTNKKWFEDLFDMKEKWVPIYVKESFWAGMSTTQRSESMNAFFDSYINSRTSLKAFVDKYDVALHAKWEKERQEDFRCTNYQPKLITELHLEKQFAGVYTLKMFYMFQQEIKSLIGCYCEKTIDHGCTKEYIVCDITQPRSFTVYTEISLGDYKCSCMQFEFRGIVCRHILCVCKKIGVQSLPDRYRLNRWSKHYKRSYLKANVPHLPILRDIYAFSQTYSALNQLMLDMVEVASRSSGLYEFLLARMSIVKTELIEISEKDEAACTIADDNDDSEHNSGDSNSSIKDPVLARSKGRPRSNRIKSAIEKRSKKKKVARSRGKVQSQPHTQPIQLSDTAMENSPATSVSGEDGAPHNTEQGWGSATELLMHFQAASHQDV